MKIGKCIKYGNVLFYEHQVRESMGGGGGGLAARGLCVHVKGGGEPRGGWGGGVGRVGWVGGWEEDSFG